MKPATPSAESALAQTFAWLRSLPRLRLLPIRDAIRTADSDSLKADAIAGLTVALLAFPLALAFATKAGLPVWCGILGAGVAAVVTPILSGSPQLSTGPTHTTAALLVGAFATVGATLPEMRVALLPALLCMTGLFVMLAAWLRLGAFADYIPRSVITAFVAAAAIRVALLQLPVAMGVSVEPSAAPFEILWRVVTAGRELLNPNLMVALGALSVFILVRRTRETGPAMLAAIATAAFFAMIAENVALSQGYAPRQGLFSYVGADARIPTELSPDVSLRTVSLLFSPALALAVLIIIETTGRARAEALKTGRSTDAHQALLGVGAANLVCAAGSGLPASSSTSQSTLNTQVGARSGLASLAKGIVILGIGTLASGIVAKIPLAALAVVVIAAERELIQLPKVQRILRSNMQDRASFLITFITALIAPFDIAIFFGTAVAIAFYLQQTRTPEVVECVVEANGELRRRESAQAISSITLLQASSQPHFGASQAFHDYVRRVLATPGLRALILKFREAQHLDANDMLLLREVATILQSSNRTLIFCEVTPETHRILADAGLIEAIGESHLILDDPSNPSRSMTEAVQLARKLTGEVEAALCVLTVGHPKLAESAASGREDA